MSSSKRSQDYYRSPEGKIKKRELNGRWRARGLPERLPQEEIVHGIIEEPILCHIQMVVSLIEERSVAMVDIFHMVERVLRQHSMDKVIRGGYGGEAYRERGP